MKTTYFKNSLLVLLLYGSSYFIQAQGITPQDLIDSWDIMNDMVIASAEKMPAEHFGFSPGAPLRNFADQLNHTTASNIGFAYAVNAGPPTFSIPDRNDPPQSKEDVLRILRDSFSYFRGGLMALEQKDLDEMVNWGRPDNPKRITRLKAILIVMSHLQREHGKTMMYLRAQGITPAPAGSWKF